MNIELGKLGTDFCLTGHRVGIIGGGPRRLMTAFLLEKRSNFSCDITLFEGRPRLGGKIVTEACEDLYEGANDRVADYRWYTGGHRLEVGITLLLPIEVACS